MCNCEIAKYHPLKDMIGVNPMFDDMVVGYGGPSDGLKDAAWMQDWWADEQRRRAREALRDTPPRWVTPSLPIVPSV